jgi:hypothetical protein
MGKGLFIHKMLAMSTEKRDFQAARAEWRWIALLDGSAAPCLCGRPVSGDACLIEHSSKGARACIGSCCAQDLMGWPAKNIFAGWRRVREDLHKPFNEDFVAFAHANGILSDWEDRFYRDTWRKRALSAEQEAKRVQVNRKALRVIGERMVGGPSPTRA